jgi:endothelin-converting enzyme/putative endopeptidase
MFPDSNAPEGTAVLKSRLSVATLLFVSTAAIGAPHGILPGDINREGVPCDDFYNYANGAWRAQNAIPDYMDRWSRRWQSGEVNKEHVRDILNELSAAPAQAKGSPGQLAGDYYAACMNEAAVDAAGLKPIEPMLAQVRAITDRAGVVREIIALSATGIAAPVPVYGTQDLHEPTLMVAQVDAGGLGMPDRDYYLKPEQRFVEARAKYLEHMQKMFVLAGIAPEAARAKAQSVFVFEKKLAEASLDNVALRDPKQQDHKMSFAQLQKLTPSFDWGAYFDAANIPRADLNVAQPAFLARFEELLAKGDIADWRNYLEWSLYNNAANRLSTPIVEQNFAFYGKYLSGATTMKPRAIRCASDVDGQLGEALGKAYVEKYFPPEAKVRMESMVDNIVWAMKDTIEHLDWMSQETKQKALEKLASFDRKIGYPDKWRDYKGVEVGRDSYWDDAMSATRWNVADNRNQIGKPVDRTRWGMTPPTSNAYYNPSLNEIVFPAGILQPPAFDVTATDAVNYGAIGVVIGHEISHGFDDQGAQFDGKGRLANWWTDADQKQFTERGMCVVNQFEGYFIEPGVHHNGKLVLGESIGDLGGAKLAFKAYQHSREGKGPEPTLDGFTPEQQFFLSWGQWRGDEIRMETQRTMVQGDPHPIAKWRVNGPLSNLPAFQQAFSCKPGDAMVRDGKDRCEVW